MLKVRQLEKILNGLNKAYEGITVLEKEYPPISFKSDLEWLIDQVETDLRSKRVNVAGQLKTYSKEEN